MPVQVSPQLASVLPPEGFLFSDLHHVLVRNLATMGCCRPTEIQKSVVPVVLSGHDALMTADNSLHLATAALLPIVHRLLTTPVLRDKKKPACVIVTKTAKQARELFGIALDLSQGTSNSCSLETGDFDMEGLGATILVTPMSLLCRLLSKRETYMTSCKFLVVIDQELEDLKRAPREVFWNKEARQTLVLGGSLSDGIQEAAEDMMRKDYLFIFVENHSIGNTNKGQKVKVIEVQEGEDEDVCAAPWPRHNSLSSAGNDEANDRKRYTVREKEYTDRERQQIDTMNEMVEIGKMMTDFSDTMLALKRDMEGMKNTVDHLKTEVQVVKAELRYVKDEVLKMKQDSHEGRQYELFKKDISQLKEDMKEMNEVADTAMLTASEVLKIKQKLKDLSLL